MKRAPKKLNLATYELCSHEASHRTGKTCVVEVHEAAGEPGAAEAHRTAREDRAAEIAAIEDHAREVKVQPLPGRHRVIPEMLGDYPDDCVTDLAAGFETKTFLGGVVASRITLVGQSQVSAQD